MLTGSLTQRAGMVRVCTNGTWSKICGGLVDNNLANVICSQLGFSTYGMTFMICDSITSLCVTI